MITANCTKCRRKLTLTAANAVIHAYYYLAWMCWLEYYCECGAHCEMWVENHEKVLEKVTETNAIGVIVEDIPDEGVIAQYNAMYGCPPEQYNLPPSLLKLCDTMGVILENIPDELLWYELTTSTISNLPERWV